MRVTLLLALVALATAMPACTTDKGQLSPQPSCGRLNAHAECKCEKPVYPGESRQRREEGTVIVAIVISPEGQVTHAEITQSSGYPRLDAATLASIFKTCFKPRMRDGVPEEFRTKFEMVWRLE